MKEKLKEIIKDFHKGDLPKTKKESGNSLFKISLTFFSS